MASAFYLHRKITVDNLAEEAMTRAPGPGRLPVHLRSRTLTAGETRAALQGQPPIRRSYNYRLDGFVAEIADDRTGIRHFDLDPVGRITAVAGDRWSERYSYDASGNVTNASWPADGGDARGEREYTGTLIRRAGGIRYDHDAQGRVVVRKQQGRSSESLGSWRYTWDAQDRLVAVVTPDGTRWRYLYDAFGRRIAKERVDSDQPRATAWNEFVWDGVVLAEEIHMGRVTTWDWEPNTFRAIGQTEHTPMIHPAGDELEQNFYAVVTDLVGAPTDLVSPEGDRAWDSHTNIWGAALPQPGRTVTCPLRFPGQYFDEETELSYNLFRYYDPAVARYYATDPIGLSGGPNPHGYVRNPTRSTDPLGLAAYDLNNPVGTIVNERGVRVVIHSNDHPPPHAHVTGGGPETRIGQNGRPLRGDPELTRRQAEVVDANRQTIRDAIGNYMRWFRGQGK
jgi:RHS repeat-associated protein